MKHFALSLIACCAALLCSCSLCPAQTNAPPSTVVTTPLTWSYSAAYDLGHKQAAFMVTNQTASKSNLFSVAGLTGSWINTAGYELSSTSSQVPIAGTGVGVFYTPAQHPNVSFGAWAAGGVYNPTGRVKLWESTTLLVGVGVSFKF